MSIELTVVEIALLEDGLRALEAEGAPASEKQSVRLSESGEAIYIFDRVRMFTLLRGKLAGLKSESQPPG
jgi:hypothetical protein